MLPEPMTWLNAVSLGDGSLSTPTQIQTWHTYVCHLTCVNYGPWEVYVGEGERFICSACGSVFTEVRS